MSFGNTYEVISNLISEKERLLEARLKMLTYGVGVDLSPCASSKTKKKETEPSTPDDSYHEFETSILKISIKSLQTDIAELNVELINTVRGKFVSYVMS